MSPTRVTPELVEVVLSPWEKLAALHGDLRLPRSSVRSARALTDGLAAVRGLRAPGTAVPGLVKIGTWRRRGATCFAVVRSGRPALLLELVGTRYDTVVVSTPDAPALARELSR